MLDVEKNSGAGAPKRSDHVPTTGRRADIQGLRALAVILVVAFHAGLPLSGGFIGVDMFFVVSGFVISRMLLQQLQHQDGISFTSFYARRTRRLLPALSLLTVVVAASSALLLSPLGPQQATANTGIAASLFSANLQLTFGGGGGYFAPAVEVNALLHTWSLSVEEQFYFAFPACLLLAWHVAGKMRGRRPQLRTVAVFVLLATAASFAVSCYTTYSTHGLSQRIAFFSPITRAWEFGVGVLLALASSVLAHVGWRFARMLGVAGLVLVVVGAVTLSETTAFPGISALLPVIGTSFILIAGTATDRGVSSALAMGPAVWIGDVSYGWYLWHWPLIVFATALWPGNRPILVVVAVGSLLPAALSRRLVENPIRYSQSFNRRRTIVMVAACIVVPIIACLGLFSVNRLQMQTTAVASYNRSQAEHADRTRQCNQPIDQRTTTQCTWSVEPSRGTIFLVGDSNAGHFTEPISQAANQLGYNLTVAAFPSCPFVDLLRADWRGDSTECYRRVTETLDALTKARPALVIIAGATGEWLTDWSLRDPRTGEIARTPESKLAFWEVGLTSVLSQLAQAGVRTLVIHQVPNFSTDWQPIRCPAIRIFSHSCPGASIDRAQVEREQQPARDAENRAVAGVPGAAAADLTDSICSAETCANERDGVALYQDRGHLSVDGALTLTGRFRELIADHAE